MSRLLSIIIISTIFWVSCKPKQEEPKPDASKGTYFSIKQFADDQWATFRGQPFGMQKVVYMNGKTDSSYTTAYDVNWGTIFNPFFESDISDPKFLGKYRYSVFKDDNTYSVNLFYEAVDDKLFTRKLVITLDELTAKVKSIYIETEGKKVSRKLLYLPVTLISIQEFEHTGPVSKELRIEYRFLH